MKMKELPFRTLCAANVTQGTVSDFARWLATYIAVLVPQASVQSWWHPDLLAQAAPRTLADLIGPQRYRVDAACFVTEGPNEGFHVNICLNSKGLMTTLAVAKVDSDEATCWNVAMAASSALEFILHWNEEPRFVSMLMSLPGAQDTISSPLRRDIKVQGPVTVKPRSKGDSEDLEIVLLDRNNDTIARYKAQVPELSRAFFAARELVEDVQLVAKHLGIELLINPKDFTDQALTYIVDEHFNRQSAA